MNAHGFCPKYVLNRDRHIAMVPNYILKYLLYLNLGKPHEMPKKTYLLPTFINIEVLVQELQTDKLGICKMVKTNM